MTKRTVTLMFCIGLITVMLGAEADAPATSQLLLRKGWSIESSEHVRADGKALSMPGFSTRGWYRATLPSTVVSALVSGRLYPDPNFGTNLRTLPGASYPIATNFSNVPMPPESPFRSSWWFRADFQVPAEFAGKTVRLHFDGINFRANVWLNGRQIAASDKMAGAWRLFEYDVTGVARPGQMNALAVEIFPPSPEDLAITFVDWNPQPPDKNMGIWRDVRLSAGGPVALRWPQVVTKLNIPKNDQAELTVSADLRNDSNKPVKGLLKCSIDAIEFSQGVTLAPGETKEVVFDPARYLQLNLANPRLWWPTQTGPQNLYPLNMAFSIGGKVSDQAAIRFGVRQVASYIDELKHRRFQVNGKDILIRGAGYSFDMMLRSTPENQEAQLQYVRDMNLNSIRLEGKLEDTHFLDLCDEYGIIVLAGWCCCDHWERWKAWDDEDRLIANESLKDQIHILRHHASVFNWMNGSDNPPPADIEKGYLNILEGYRWPDGVMSSATEQPTTVSGETGVRMTGPYEYLAPSYWLLEKKDRGGAHGFNTETSCGPAVPPIESLKQMLPGDHLWPIDATWNFHAGGGVFRDLHVFTEALNTRYGAATGIEDYAQKAQVMAYEGHRAMFEAYGRNKYTSTGVIQWMLNNAWPSMIWHLYDYYLRPGGSYFGAKKGCEPLHVQYSYDDASVVVVNSYYKAFPGLKVKARIFNLDMTEKFSKEAGLDVGEDSSMRVFTIPALSGLSSTYFLRLDLLGAKGESLSSNLYWLSTKKEELDWEHSAWYYTPTKVFDDLTALQTLPQVELKMASTSKVQGERGITRVTVENPGKNIAFFVRLKVDKPSGEEVLPVLWQDNYFSLLPGEKREVTATYKLKDLAPAGQGPEASKTLQPVLEVSGWNISNPKPFFFQEHED
jgi:exo-1,4-beta-D-glucosaminidase